MIKDKNIEWLRQSYIIHPERFHGLVNTTIIESMAVGATQLLEFSTFGYGAYSIAAAADSIACLDFQFPRIFDPNYEVGVRVLWGVVGTVATDDAIHWKVTYRATKINVALTSPLAGTGVALDTVIAIQSPEVTTTLRWYRTGRGKINAQKLDMGNRNGPIAFEVEADVLTQFSADEVKFLGLELDYIPLLCANGTEDASYRQRLAAD